MNQEYMIIINIFAPNIRTPKYMRKTLAELKEDMVSSTMIGGDFRTHT